MKSGDSKTYWNQIYSDKEVDKLGWHEENPEPSISLIKKCNINKNSTILNVGAGATTLVDELLKIGYKNLIAADISPISLDKLKKRINKPDSKKVTWIIDDLTNSQELIKLSPVDLWHDRAVLHFFTKKEDIKAYFNLLKKLVKKGGYLIIAVFNLDGASTCSGLPVCRYNDSMLEEMLGDDFKLIEAFDYNYTMPSGDTRKYIYTLFKSSK